MKSQLSLEALVAFAALLALVAVLLQSLHLLRQQTEAQGAVVRLHSQEQLACWNAQSFAQKFVYAKMNASLPFPTACEVRVQEKEWG